MHNARLPSWRGCIGFLAKYISKILHSQEYRKLESYIIDCLLLRNVKCVSMGKVVDMVRFVDYGVIDILHIKFNDKIKISHRNMPRRSITLFNRARIIALIQEGLTQTAVANRLGVNQSDVPRGWRRYQQTHSVSDRLWTGRPRSTTAAQDRFVMITATRRPMSTATELRADLRRASGVQVSTQTIRNRLHTRALHARRPLRRVHLLDRHRAARQTWAQEHHGWGLAEWRQMLFTDETRIALHPDSRRKRVWRRKGSRARLQHVQEVRAFRGGSVMFWAGIMLGRRTPLVPLDGILTGQRYILEVLQPIVRPFRAEFGDQFILLDDNARPHRAEVVQNFLQQSDIARMQWPAMSPDMNCIEHAWDMLKRAIAQRPHPPITLQDVIEAAIEEWDRIPQDVLDNLIRGMPRRVRTLLDVHGGHVCY